MSTPKQLRKRLFQHRRRYRREEDKAREEIEMKRYDSPTGIMDESPDGDYISVDDLVRLPVKGGDHEVTQEHRIRADVMIGCGLDQDEVAQWLATHDADKDDLDTLQQTVAWLRDERQRAFELLGADDYPNGDLCDWISALRNLLQKTIPILKIAGFAPGAREIEAAIARAELKRITPSNARLKELAAKSPPPSDWLEGPEEDLF